MIEAALYTLLLETEQAAELLPAAKVIEYFANMAKYDNRFTENLIGKDKSGREIFSYSFGNGPHNCLYYAFPEPGSALGGRGIIALANLLQAGACNFKHMPVTWHFIPCLNFADQPDNDITASPGIKGPKQKADWSSDNMENAALLKAASQIKPCFTFAMHDETQAKSPASTYLGVTRQLTPESVKLIRTVFARCKTQFNSDYKDPEMGDGFFLISSIGKEYSNSTFAKLANHGQVLIADIAKADHLKISDLVFLQLAAGLIAMNEIIKHP